MLWVILYLRVSTAEQAKQQYNLPSQEKKLRDYCQQQNLRILHLFIVRGDSSGTANRPEFTKMLAYCRGLRVNISKVIVADLSRLARYVMDQGTAIATLESL